MPSKSKAQQRLMQGAAKNPTFAKKVGVPKKVAKKYTRADRAPMVKALSDKPGNGGY
jgi:hypothetical protein